MMYMNNLDLHEQLDQKTKAVTTIKIIEIEKSKYEWQHLAIKSNIQTIKQPESKVKRHSQKLKVTLLTFDFDFNFWFGRFL